jgi:serine/threonine protein kinase
MARAKTITIETAFSSYTLGSILGEGGAGRVFVATDVSGRQWALKLLEAKRATTERRKRFKNEILFSQHTNHSNIVPVIDYGIAQLQDGPAPFYVMPRYVGSLRDLIKRPVDPQRRLRYFDQILSGIEAAHLAGVVHRDIKPENILFDDKTDNLVLADFGVAHFTDEELYTAAETAPDTRLANFLYAAPEQRVRGQNVDARADIYALGLLLNELFTGIVPHGTGYRTVAESLPDYAWLDGLVESMLRQQPDHRPASVDVVKRALIAHKQDYVTRQRLDELKKVVVPTTAVMDPLVDAPPTIVDFEWAKGQLTLILSQRVNANWVQALQNMGSYSSLWGKGPERFSFAENRARISAAEHEVQEIINSFKDWLPRATAKYRENLERERRDAEERQRAQLRAEQEELERQRRLRESVRL